ncbi:MAG TPA: YigZ family protein [Cyclobacteriaceae bacterium]
MGEFSYLTVQNTASGLYKEKGSKFISYVYPIESEVDVKSNLEVLRKKHYDARHHCYAWVLGADNKRHSASDDGEPNHSARDPILGQIRSKNLTNVLVVVVRYFGGTKLGIGGLIVAYRLAAQDALEKCAIIEKDVTQTLILTYDYAYTPEVMKLVKDFDLVILSQEFDAHCLLKADVKLSFKKKIIERIDLLNATGSSVRIDGLK